MTSPESVAAVTTPERERLEAVARAFAVHFNDPVLLFPDVFTLDGLRVVVAFQAERYTRELVSA